VDPSWRPSVAAAIAYEPPIIPKAWDAFQAHIPTIMLIWLITIVLSVNGVVAPLALTALGHLVGVMFVAVPSMHDASGEVIGTEPALRVLMHRPIRYLLAGVLFTVVAAIGFVLWILPGLAVTLVMPVFVNKVFLNDSPILEVFFSSFQAV
jgi:hypothetical protein